MFKKKKKKVFKDACCAIISSWKENCLNKALKANYQITMARLMTWYVTDVKFWPQLYLQYVLWYWKNSIYLPETGTVCSSDIQPGYQAFVPSGRRWELCVPVLSNAPTVCPREPAFHCCGSDAVGGQQRSTVMT